jgi:diguanylate cyclase (GGDEF)-like protein
MVDPENEAEKTASVGPRWYQGRVYPVEPKPGRPASAVWLTIDISDQKQLEQELKKLSDLDDLTGVCNRRYFLRTLENEIEIARRRSQTLSLIFLDVDYFKRINDRYGHVQGDRALQHLTRTISKHLRNRDLFARIGGEEFAILCPSTSQQEALLLAERICRTVADAPMEIKNGCIPLTISLGVASLSDSDTAIGQLLRRADQALYQAKSDGRNRACSYATFRLGQAEIAGA